MKNVEQDLQRKFKDYLHKKKIRNMEIYITSSWGDSLSGYRIFKNKYLALCEWIKSFLIEKNLDINNKSTSNKLEIHLCTNDKDFHIINTYHDNILEEYLINKTDIYADLLEMVENNELSQDIIDWILLYKKNH